jgi:hypothetical protein
MMWQVVCPETGWRSAPYPDRAAAEDKARSIDVEIARVNGISAHRHPVVAADDHAASERSAPMARPVP